MLGNLYRYVQYVHLRSARKYCNVSQNCLRLTCLSIITEEPAVYIHVLGKHQCQSYRVSIHSLMYCVLYTLYTCITCIQRVHVQYKPKEMQQKVLYVIETGLQLQNRPQQDTNNGPCSSLTTVRHVYCTVYTWISRPFVDRVCTVPRFVLIQYGTDMVWFSARYGSPVSINFVYSYTM